RPPPRTETTSTSARRALARVERVFVLGIDPGLSRCGYGVVRQYGSDLTAMAGGVVMTEPDLPLQERLRVLFTELRALVVEMRPDAVVVERVQRMVAALPGPAAPPKPPDVADALALAVCHLTAQPLRRAIEAAGSGKRP